ncbi:MAG: hypothetical protein V2A74_02075 [bacterium]
MLRRFWLLLLLPGLLVGCGQKDEIGISPEFSMNLARPVNAWPKNQHLTPAQKYIFDEYGPPEYLRLWWVSDGMLQSQNQVQRILRSKEIKEIKSSWLYPQKNVEVLFDSPDNYRELPIGDRLGILMQFGDPDGQRVNTSYKEGLEEWWTYYSRGEIYIFRDGKLFEKRNDFPPMGIYLRR